MTSTNSFPSKSSVVPSTQEQTPARQFEKVDEPEITTDPLPNIRFKQQKMKIDFVVSQRKKSESLSAVINVI